MTEQYEKSAKLFELEEENKSEEKTTPQRVKRNSWKTRFPVRSPPVSRGSSAETMSGDESGSSPKGSGGNGSGGTSSRESFGGSVLGVPGLSFKEKGSTVLVGKDDKGENYTVDIFYSVFSSKGLKNDQFEQLLNYLNSFGKLDYVSFIEGISYQGFDRLFYITAALKKVSINVFCRFAILGAVRGSNFQKIKESCTDMPQDLDTLVSSGTIIKKAKKRDDLTILRFTASIPHWVAFWLFSVDMAKKIESNECPGWLQFPGAASLPMGKKLRLQHISFCKEFSALLPGGIFNGNIYKTAYMNQIPVSDVPTMIKEHLGIGRNADVRDQITPAEVTAEVLMTVARTK